MDSDGISCTVYTREVRGLTDGWYLTDGLVPAVRPSVSTIGVPFMYFRNSLSLHGLLVEIPFATKRDDLGRVPRVRCVLFQWKSREDGYGSGVGRSE